MQAHPKGDKDSGTPSSGSSSKGQLSPSAAGPLHRVFSKPGPKTLAQDPAFPSGEIKQILDKW